MKKHFFFYAVHFFVFLFVVMSVKATVYEVKPNTPLDTIAEVPWANLQPGDTVLIHWRATAYKEKWVICRQGTADAPITVRGVPNSNGDLPVIDGNGAVTPRNLNFASEQRGVIKIGSANIPADTMPRHIVIENLEIRSAHPNYQFTDDGGNTQTYTSAASSIYVEKGENITVRNCKMHDSANGFFVASSDATVSRSILVDGNYIFGNGIAGSAFQHNNYTAAIGITFQYNRFGAMRSGANGNALKDRSAGTVVRYNWIEAGNRQLDLVEGEDSIQIRSAPEYRQTFVYGNVLIEPDGAGNSQIAHYGGDNGDESTYRKGKLYFYNNTVVSTRTGNTTLFRLSSGDETCDARNNIFYVTASGANLALLDDTGFLTISHNWFKPGWRNSHSNQNANVNNDGTSVQGTTPGFINFASQDFRLASDSPAVNAGTSLHSDVLPTHNVVRQYVKHQQSETRPANGVFDIGAFESQPVVTVSGQVTNNGNALPGASVALSGSITNSVTTDSSGNYSFIVAAGGSYTITPTLANYTFTPASATFNNLSSNQTANFTATNTCSYSINPTSATVNAESGTDSVAVTAPSGCAWTAVSNAAWLSVTSGAAGSGNGTVGYSVAANSGAARTGTITIAGQTFTINQAAASYSIAGTVSYGTTPAGNPAKYVFGVSLNAAGTPSATTATDISGAYSLNGLGTGSYTVTPSKTAETNNTGISLQDASEVAKYVFNQRTFTPNQLIAADATGNGSVSLQDASEIAKRAFNIASTNIIGQWKFAPASRTYPSISSNLTGENYDAILVGDVTGNWMPPMADPPAKAIAESETDETATAETAKTNEILSIISVLEQQRQQSAADNSVFAALPTDRNEINQNNQAEERNAGAAISVSLPNAQGSAGATVLIPVTVGDLTGLNVTAYDLTVTFDPNILQPASPAFETAGTLTGNAGGYSPFTDPGLPSGKLRVGAFGTAPLSGQGTLIFLRFTVLAGAAATSPLDFENFIFGEGTPQDSTTNGSFMRLGPTAASAAISGRVLTANGNGIGNARVTITDSQGSTRTVVSTSFRQKSYFSEFKLGRKMIDYKP